MSVTPLHSVSVAGVTLDDAGRVLLIRRRDNNQWQIPGGILELSETFAQGVIREVLEETGVDVRVRQLTGVYKNIILGVVALVYRCDPVGGHASCTDEASVVDWIPVDEALNRMAPVFAIRLSDALDERPPLSRAHDGTRVVD